MLKNICQLFFNTIILNSKPKTHTMFIMPHPLHFAECMQYHYKLRMADAKTTNEFNFCSQAYHYYSSLVNAYLC